MTTAQANAFKSILSLPTVEAASQGLIGYFSDPTKTDPRRIDDLSTAFQELVASSPADATKFSDAIARLDKAPGLPQVPDTWKQGELTSVHNELHKSLYEQLKAAWNDYDDFKDGPAIVPSHPYLTGSLFSAALARYDLGLSAEALGEIADGLRLPESQSEPDRKGKKQQLLSVGACIQLVAAGSKIYSSGGRATSAGKLYLSALTKLADDQVITHASGVKLLEVAINHAKEEFRSDLSLRETWATLFPPA